MTLFFSVEGGPIWIKFRRLVQNDMSTAVMWSKSKSDVEFQYGGFLANSMASHPRATCHIAVCCHLANSMSWSQSYMSHCRVLPPGEFDGRSSQRHVSHCRVLPLGEFTVMIPEPHGTLQGAVTCSWYCHIAGCNDSIRHIENRFSPYFIFFVF